MDEPAAHLAPSVGVLATDDNDVGRHAQISQGAMKTNRLLSLVADLRLHNEEVDIAAWTGLSASMGPEQDDLRIGSCCSQAAPGLGNQSLVNYLHYRIVVISDHLANKASHLAKMIAKASSPGKDRRGLFNHGINDTLLAQAAEIAVPILCELPTLSI